MDYYATLKAIRTLSIKDLEKLKPFINFNIRSNTGLSLAENIYLKYEKFKYIVDSGCDLISLDKYGSFNYICDEYLVKYIEELHQKLTIDCSIKDRYGRNFVRYSSDDNKVMLCLLDQHLINFDINEKNNEGSTIMHDIFAHMPNRIVIDKLLNIRDSFNRTLDTSIKDNLNKTALEYALPIVPDDSHDKELTEEYLREALHKRAYENEDYNAVTMRAAIEDSLYIDDL